MDTLTEMLANFPHALAAGLLIATACAAIGQIVVLKRLVFIGVTLSETAACGIAAGLFWGFDPLTGAVALTLAAVTLIAFQRPEYRVPKDAVLAALFIFTASCSVLLVSKSAHGLEEVKALLYGDLVLTTPGDLNTLTAVLLPALACFLLFQRPLVYTFADRDEAQVLGLRVRFWELLFYYLLAAVVSAASKLGGMLLVSCFLTLPPMTGLLIAKRWQTAMAVSVLCAAASVPVGFLVSYTRDLPVNPVIAAVSFALLLCAAVLKSAVKALGRRDKIKALKGG